MRKMIVLLAVLVGLAGMQTVAEARGGNGFGGGRGAGSAALTRTGGAGFQGAGDTVRLQQQDRIRDPEQCLGTGPLATSDQAQDRQRLRDPSLHTDTLPATE